MQFEEPKQSISVELNSKIMEYLNTCWKNYNKYNSLICEYLDILPYEEFITEDDKMIIRLDYLNAIIVIKINKYTSKYSMDQFMEVLFILMDYKEIYNITDESFSILFKKYPTTGSRTKKAMNQKVN